jgi:hypothetical protein
MALDPIWQQQLTLVTYGNQYLSQDLSFSRWINHSIFEQHVFAFRDLISQQLLAQHFQVWIEGLKSQGVTRLSLHCSSLLLEEKNPNANIELIPYAHFIVSHSSKHKYAWICGRELAAWYNLEQDYQAPKAQQITTRIETLWRYELNTKLAKRIAADLQQPDWDDIDEFLQKELFKTSFAQDLALTDLDRPFYGINSIDNQSQSLALIPTDIQADYVHQTLHRFNALTQHIHNVQDTQSFSQQEHLQYRHFAEKLDDLQGKFIVKAANHYATAHLSNSAQATPLDPQTSVPPEHEPISSMRTEYREFPEKSHKKVGAGNVIALIFITAMLCAAAYYFGL